MISITLDAAARCGATALALVGLALAAPHSMAQTCPDDDLDGFADCTALPGCSPAGLPCGDCDDGDETINPNGLEVCNQADDDCDGEVDEGFERPTSSLALSDPDYRLADRFGQSLAALGDVDGDLVPDFAVGAYLASRPASGSGTVVVFSGATRAAICRFEDPAVLASTQYGFSLAAIGDLDGDGADDLVVGSSGRNRLALVSGADCALLREDLEPNGLNTRFGRAVGAADDLNGDGVPEVLAGAEFDGTVAASAGAAFVLDGATGLQLFKLTDAAGAASDNLGRSVTGIGDVDGDGTPDVAVGVPFFDTGFTNAGKVNLYSGATGLPIRALVDDDPNAFGDELGHSVARLGDVDGDGTEDLVAGAIGGNKAVVFSGGTGAKLFDLRDPSNSASARHGESVSALPDMTGDGVAEILVGARNDSPGGVAAAGSATLYDGATGALLRTLVDPDAATSDWAGTAVAGIADISGDGAPEFLVGAPLADRAESETGIVLIYSLEADCDGDGLSPFVGDCDDSEAARRAGADEVCDGLDNDCDGAIDEDEDGDGFDRCADCAPDDPLAYPGAPETCNGRDDDCNGLVDEGLDLDGDGFDAPCDCDDGAAATNPDTPESCDGTDENCDGVPDDAFARLPLSTTLRDATARAQAQYGRDVAVLGDVDGDGIDDFVVGIPIADGEVSLVSGATRTEICRAVDPEPTAVFSDRLGTGVAATADLTGDGVPDFLGGAPGRNISGVGNTGELVLFSGADCSFVRRMRDTSQNHEIGTAIAAIGDVNKDGTPDIAAGVPLHDTSVGVSVGVVMIFSGADGAKIRDVYAPEARANDEYGTAVVGIDDVDFDGVPDIAVGAPGDDGPGTSSGSGSVFLHSGADGSFIRRLLDPERNGGDALGNALAAIGDVDGDSVGEVLAGARADSVPGLHPDAGSIFLFSGRTGALIRRFNDPDGAADTLGDRVVGLPDIDADGVPDLAASAASDDTAQGVNAGSVLVFSGATGDLIEKFTSPESAANEFLGRSLAAGDVTGDGFPDFLAGAPDADQPGVANAGTVTLFTLETDCDGDGFVSSGGDCDDTEPTVFEGNPEVCDDLDNDCNGLVDDGLSSNPELCNGLDDNCNGLVDENNPEGGASCATGGLGVCEPGTLQCTEGVLACQQELGPGPELCNGLDDDCDGVTDEAADSDGDGFDDCSDNCVDAFNPGQQDGDADGFGDVCDCLPGNPDNPLPGAVGADLVLDDDGSGSTLLSWGEIAGAQSYNVYRGWNITGDSFEYNQQCLESRSPNATSLDELVPRKGVSFFYLVSGFCGTSGEGSLGASSDGTERPKVDACPTGSLDTDGDGFEEADDNCPGFRNESQSDVDDDSRGDACDNCPELANLDQSDLDGDGAGDVCDPDQDGDGVLDDGDGSGIRGDNPCVGGATAGCDDNCPRTANPAQEDGDADGIGDACEA